MKPRTKAPTLSPLNSMLAELRQRDEQSVDEFAEWSNERPAVEIAANLLRRKVSDDLLEPYLIQIPESTRM